MCLPSGQSSSAWPCTGAAAPCRPLCATFSGTRSGRRWRRGGSLRSAATRLAWRAAVALAFCFAVEFSQLVHLPALDALRRTTAGHLALGSGFDPRDFAERAPPGCSPRCSSTGQRHDAGRTRPPGVRPRAVSAAPDGARRESGPFLIALGAFWFINWWDCAHPTGFDMNARCGVPFNRWQDGNFSGFSTDVLRVGLLADLVVGLLTTIVVHGVAMAGGEAVRGLSSKSRSGPR